MDDRELELRLQAHLHRRFDDAQVPAGLEAAVLQGMRTQPRRVAFDLRRRPIDLGWSLVAAVAVLVVGSFLFVRINGPISPGASATPGPSVTLPTSRDFIVLPPTAAVPSKASSSLATDVLSARLRALGFGTFSSGGGYAITFELGNEGPSDAAVRRVLAATGDVRFLPLPPEDYYGEHGLEAMVGQPLPKDEPALFGWEGIASVSIGAAAQGAETPGPSAMPTIEITLKPAAASAFGDYTAAHVNEHFAIVVDGKVASVPVVNGAIPGGQISIVGGGEDPDAFRGLAAILVGGLLPEEWRGADVPQVISQRAAVASALTFYPTADVESAGLTTREDERGHRAIWWIVLGGDLPHSCPMLRPGATVCPAPEGGIVVVIDAETGVVEAIEPAT